MAELICIVCPKGCHLHVDEENGNKVTGNACRKGAIYGQQELTNPVRTITSTCKIGEAVLPRVPVKTVEAIPKGKMTDIMTEINKIELHAPVFVGDIIIENVSDTGINVVACKTMEKVN
ncbi:MULTISPECIES: DUF1667 domain-containing protein [Vagococcus]|uniref:DUF1667 domain-containing protein n=1 Tax=Vagococcus fluvialis bH819 TaxID=1255619 RepID=A0A1X6WPW5_9ENTE|nr:MULTISPECIES: DUF1667 domain-containing protein [Vagococcus]SLM86381.1 hypothetical protein FM121_09840 [Vagococcus fluvialis bH819]HCM89035.1 DUF1667 domain-containing protein [Vagococcus sp.]